MKLRRHQSEGQILARKIADGTVDKKISLAHVTPGGGKSLLAKLFSDPLLDSSDVIRVLVVCPQNNLRAQVAAAFDGRLHVGWKSTGWLWKHSSDGIVTTYQDVLANPKRYEKYVSEKSTLVILDELHHLPREDWGGPVDADEAKWTRAISPIVRAAHRVLAMTGTLSRNDRAPLAFVDYDADNYPVVDIKYTRRDALEEEAIIRVSVKLADGKATYDHRGGEQSHALSTVSAEEESRTLNALLENDAYVDSVLDLAIRDFDAHWNRVPSAKMLVICKTRMLANRVHDKLISAGHKSVIAHSGEEDPNGRIAAFRDRNRGHILVTCQMAYEGLDIPSATHLVYLHNIKSRPWMEQAMSRPTRFDKDCGLPWDQQFAFIYAPDMPTNVNFFSEWVEEQDARFGERPGQTGERFGAERRRSTFHPKDGEFTGTRNADTFRVYDENDNRRIAALEERYPYLRGCPATQKLQLATDLWPTPEQIPSSSKVA